MRDFYFLFIRTVIAQPFLKSPQQRGRQSLSSQIRQPCMMPCYAVSQEPIVTIQFFADLCSGSGMVHANVQISLDLLLKFRGIFSDIMQHSTTVSPVCFPEFCRKFFRKVCSSLQVILYGLCSVSINMCKIFHFSPRFFSLIPSAPATSP